MEFASASLGSITLNVIWEITDRTDNVVELKKTFYIESPDGDDMSATVAAMSQVLRQLSSDIAKVLNELLTSSEP